GTGAVDPAAVCIDERAPAVRQRVGATGVQLLDRRAALVGVPLSQVPPPGAELGQHEISQALGSGSFVAAVAIPGIFDYMAGPGGIEFVRAVVPDHRNRVPPCCRASSFLQLQPLLQ